MVTFALSSSEYSIQYVMIFNKPINWFDIGPLIMQKFQIYFELPQYYHNEMAEIETLHKNRLCPPFQIHTINPENLPEELKIAYDDWLPFDKRKIINIFNEHKIMYNTVIKQGLIQKE